MRWLRSVVFAALALGLVACQGPGALPSTAPTTGNVNGAPAHPATTAQAQPTALIPFRVAQPYVAAALIPLWMALEEGYFREHSLAVEAVLMRGVEATAAVSAGEAQVLFGAPTGISIGASAQDPDFAILGTTNNRLQYQLVASVPSFPELRGKLIAISRAGDSSQYLTVQTLERFGLRADDVGFIGVGPIPDRLAALLGRQVDATVVIIPANLQAVKAGFYQLADLGDLNIPYIGTSVIMRRSYAERNRAATEGFLKGLMQGNHAVLTQPERTKAVLAKYLSMDDPVELEATYQDNVRGAEPALTPSLTGLEDLIAQTAQENPAVRGMRAEQLVDLRFIQAIEASGFVRELDK
jgi:ABC-type nitrate/sulfonate/bicarbonate transport system substrate-binding protein